MTLESSKTLGIIGAILMVIGPFASFYTGIIGLIGLVLVLVAFHGFASIYSDRGIFNNAIFGVASTIIGVAIAAGVFVYAAFGFLSALNIHVTWNDWSGLTNYNWTGFNDWNAVAPYIAAMIVGWVIFVALFVVAAIFLRRSFRTLSEKSGTHMFATAGMLLLIGAILTVIFIGLILVWISLILLAVAFFEMRTTPPMPQPSQSQMPAPSPA